MQAEHSFARGARCLTWVTLLWLLTPLCASAAAPAGSWWMPSYPYRQQILIPAGASSLSSGYAVSFVLNHSAEVSAGRSLASGNDVRIVRWNGSAWVELNRVIEPPSAWNTTTTRIWFQTAAAINLNTTDDNYYVYYGNAAAPTPPQNGDMIFTLWDEFTTALDTTNKWTPSNNGISVAGGTVSLSVNATLQSKSSFGVNTIWETRARTSDALPGGGDKQYYFFLASNSATYTGNHLGFFADTNGNYVLSRNTAELKTAITNSTFNYKKYGFARDSTTQVRYFLDGTQVALHNNAANVTTASLPIRLRNDANGSRTMIYDWIRVRPYRNPDPTLSLAAREEMASGRHFLIIHDRLGIRCTGETITVRVLDASNALVTNYTSNITLTTGTSSGTWTRISGSGTFVDATANDGVATYTWPSGQSQAVFSLVYGDGPSPIDIDVYQTSDSTVRDDDTEGTMAFAQSGFTLTSAVLVNPSSIAPFASPQTAGTSVPVYIYPYGTTATDTQCGVIEAYTGNKTLKFWSSYSDPSTGTRNVTINGTAIGTSAATATSVIVNFQNGQGAVTAKYKDVGALAINISDPNVSDPALPAGAQGSTGTVVFRPHTFVLSNIRKTAAPLTANPAAASSTGAVFMAAGEPFSVTVNARDAEGADTPNYGRESTPESVALSASLVQPAGGRNPALQFSDGFGAFASGAATATDFAWPEVGIVTLTPSVADGSYLGAGNVIGTTSANVGRFIPAYFEVTPNVPMFTPGCMGAGVAYTYVGQPFEYMIAPVLTVTARESSGNVTENYAGSFAKITDATVTSRTYIDTTGHALDTSRLPASTTAMTIGTATAGTLPLTFNVGTVASGGGLLLQRGTTPLAPFDPDISLSFQLSDSDGVLPASNPVSFDDIGFMMSPQQRWGRIAFRNAVGSELVDLPLPMRSEYYMSDAVGFVPNTADTCTAAITIGPSAIAGVSTTATFTAPPSSAAPGDFRLVLRAPGSGNSGTTRVTPQVPSWLQYDWNPATAGMENPTGVATFGIYQGSSKQIYRREKF